MAVKNLIAIACLLALAQGQGLQINSEGKVKITTVTTSGCGDTVNFIRDQLAPAYELYGRFMDIEFVPWGRTTWVDTIVCQFGNNDCWANRLHRCALNYFKDDQPAQMKYMLCEFSAPFPAFRLGTYECALASGINLVEIDRCVANNHDDLDRAAQAASAAPMAAINFVPAIVFNDVINIDQHREAFNGRLASKICFALADVPDTGITSCQI